MLPHDRGAGRGSSRLDPVGNRLAINWKIGLPTGWGVYGLNLALELVRKGVFPVILEANPALDITELTAFLLKEALTAYRALGDGSVGNIRGEALDCPVLQPLGDRLWFPERFANRPGQPDIGVVFFEHVDIPPADLERAASLPLIIAGSDWNAQVLRGLGLDNVAVCPQGVDLSLFHPGPRRNLFPDQFLIFSGGKFEYRKGQDLVLAAFRAFQERHSEARLVCAWSNLWPASMADMAASPHVIGLPQADGHGELELAPWLADNGIPPETVFPIRLRRNSLMPQILRECDLALFPSRCEGGTNLVAMEAMACGVPTILSANTGHRDLLGPHILSLTHQGPVANGTGREGWGESEVEEMLAAMEQAWADREALRQLGLAGAAFMADWSWSHQVDRLLTAITGGAANHV